MEMFQMIISINLLQWAKSTTFLVQKFINPGKKLHSFCLLKNIKKEMCKTLLIHTVTNVGGNAQKLTSWEYYRNLQLILIFTSRVQV